MEGYESDGAHAQIKEWIKEVLNNQENYDKVEVEMTGTNEKGEGYIGDIVFTKVLTEQNGVLTEHHIVLKIGKTGATRDLVPVRKAFEREICFYTKCLPGFNQFLQHKRKNHAKIYEIDFVTNCFGTLLLKDTEVICLQNLREIGYELHNRKEPMNLNHMKLTLETYAKYHALSFAMKAQNPNLFHEVIEKNMTGCPWQLFNLSNVFTEAVNIAGQFFHQALKDNGETGLLKLYEEKMAKGTFQVWKEYLDMKFQENVLTHGDCWNSNFMFKYKEEDKSKTTPYQVCFLDFQLCQLSTPVSDLSYHLYSVCPPEILTNPTEFAQLLIAYHNSLRENLQELGTDVEKCFTFRTFMEHWKKYSGLGMICGGLIVPACLQEKEDVQTIEDMGKSMEVKLEKFLKGEVKEKLQRRLVAMVKNNLELTPNL